MFTEPHVCTGKFQDDFNELCLRANLYTTPGIVHRARRPGTPPPPVEAKPEKGGQSYKIEIVEYMPDSLQWFKQKRSKLGTFEVLV